MDYIDSMESMESESMDSSTWDPTDHPEPYIHNHGWTIKKSLHSKEKRTKKKKKKKGSQDHAEQKGR